MKLSYAIMSSITSIHIRIPCNTSVVVIQDCMYSVCTACTVTVHSCVSKVSFRGKLTCSLFVQPLSPVTQRTDLFFYESYFVCVCPYLLQPYNDILLYFSIPCAIDNKYTIPMFKKLTCLSRLPNNYNKRISVFLKTVITAAIILYLHELPVSLTDMLLIA
jgi:hypothetical protein